MGNFSSKKEFTITSAEEARIIVEEKTKKEVEECIANIVKAASNGLYKTTCDMEMKKTFKTIESLGFRIEPESSIVHWSKFISDRNPLNTEFRSDIATYLSKIGYVTRQLKDCQTNILNGKNQCTFDKTQGDYNTFYNTLKDAGYKNIQCIEGYVSFDPLIL